MTIISEIIASFIRIILCLFFITREKPSVKKLLIAAAGAVISCLIRNYGSLPFLYLSAFEIIVIMLCLRLSSDTDRRKNLFFSIMYEIGTSIWIFIFSEALARLFGMSVFTDRNTLWGQLPLWLVNIVLITAALIICGGRNITLRTVSFAAVFGIFAIVPLADENTFGDDMTFTYFILSVVLLAGIMVYRLSRQYETEKELAELKERQAELLERDYNVLNKAYSENARTFHDMHNHIGAVRSLLTAEKYDKAIEYLDNLQKPVSGIASTVWTGDETVDYLISSRIAAAENEGIGFETQIEFPKNTDIGGADLCAVLGNLLDNAFDAVRKDDVSENRSIKLTVRRINRMLIIKVANTFSGQLRISDGKLKTTKTDKGLHGWGVESARTAAEKYDGTITTTSENGIFTAVATLYF
ncbi:MAG: GHKL domain-containing protein [Ruminiclostridium sp.]|nr:GHKL domain-containing protein [Ruminiclostridium sp.]